MYYTITHLDWRYSGKNNFEFRLEFPLRVSVGGQSIIQSRWSSYQQIRDWLWGSYGPSCERDLYNTIYCSTTDRNPVAPSDYVPVWAWHYASSDNQPFIYIVDQATLAHLQLKWA